MNPDAAGSPRGTPRDGAISLSKFKARDSVKKPRTSFAPMFGKDSCCKDFVLGERPQRAESLCRAGHHIRVIASKVRGSVKVVSPPHIVVHMTP